MSFSDFQSELPAVRFSLDEMLEAIRMEHFPHLEHTIHWSFARHESLACILFESEKKRATILLHSLLNHSDTPKEVIEMILIHELLHLEHPPREVAGKLVYHPPEFWEAEKTLARNREDVWAWLIIHFHFALRSDRKNETTWVKPRIAKTMLSHSRLSMEAFRESFPHLVCDERKMSEVQGVM